ncbi:MAG TPA: cytochrome c [Thermoanaerobaculia bacterium]|nr:cytochrome c [Thermoanaerobaculia bacterium]
MSTERRQDWRRRPPRRPAPGGASRRPGVAAAVILALLAPLAACRQDMHDQPRYEPLEASAFFADGMASRQPVAGTVPRGFLREDVRLTTGRDEAGDFVATLPMPLSRPLLERGRERYDVFCSPCHGRLGDGQGMVTRRGFKQPPSLHQERLRQQPAGYFVDVMAVGFGVMPSYASQISPEDRWAIAAYVQVLQLSQNTAAGELSEVDREALERATADVAAVPPAAGGERPGP